MSQEVPKQVEQKQRQIVKKFYGKTFGEEPIDDQLTDYLNENPGLRVVTMAASGGLDRLLVVLEPVAEEAKGCSAVLTCPIVRP